MSDTIAIVTGAASGIGAATAALFREQGWVVVGVDSAWSRTKTAQDVELDISDAEAWAGFLGSVDRVDVLVNNAAVNRATPLGETGPGGWRELFAVNLEAAAVAIDALAPALARSRGAVINVASVHAFATTAGMSAYAASKAGLVGLTRAAAVELGPAGVRVNAVAPGAVESPMLLPELDGAEREQAITRLRKRTPLGRIGDAEEIAETVRFLADGARSGFVTGQCMTVDGGALALLGSE